jgi:dolichyl-phosphate beta-glucosyltransferase
MQKICIVIPCYNEEKRLEVLTFLNYLDAEENIHFCFVNDGSSDETMNVLNRMRTGHEERILIVDQQPNGGKAEAVRNGVMQSLKWSDFTFVGFWDADLSTPLSEIKLLVRALNEREGCRLAMGSRIKKLGSTIERSPRRHFFGRVFMTLMNLISKIPVYDSQCGAKIFSPEVAALVFDRPFFTKWLFDVEIIARIRNRFGVKETNDYIVEVPLNTWKEVGDSKLGFRHMLKIPFDLMKISRKYN